MIKPELFSAQSLIGIPPRRQWIAGEFIPKGCVTGLFGPGGAGKSLLAQQLGTASVSGKEWLGMYVEQCPVIGYFCEDDKEELWRRQDSINRVFGISQDQVGDFYLQSRQGAENLLMTFDRGIGKQTELFNEISEDVRAHEARFLILDNAAQMYGGNENDRREVTQFVNLLHKLVNDLQVTVFLLGHPPKGNVNGQAQYSGSTAWDACFRSRLYFSRPDDKDANEDDEDASDIRQLEKCKANYSTIGQKIKVKWSEGCFVRVEEDNGFVAQLARSVKQKEADSIFLVILKKLTKQGRPASNKPTSANYAPKIMVDFPEAKAKNISTKMLQSSMTTLLNDGVILSDQEIKKVNGRAVLGLKLKGTENAA